MVLQADETHNILVVGYFVSHPVMEMTEEQQRRWIKSMADSMRKQDELEHGLLCEMARVGYFGDKYEVYINTNDPGNEPHFHVRDIKTQGEDFHTCVKIKEAVYFRHPGKMDFMNTHTRKALADFLKATPPPKKRVSFASNWEKVIYEWNENNSKMNVDEDQPMPDYTNIADNR